MKISIINRKNKENLIDKSKDIISDTSKFAIIEGYKIARANLMFSLSARDSKCVAITSWSKGEVKFLVKQRVIGNMHLAVNPQERPVRIQYGRRIMIESRRPFFEKRRDDHHFILFCNCGKSLRRRPGNTLRQRKIRMVLALAKILGFEELVRADNFRSLLSRFFCQ